MKSVYAELLATDFDTRYMTQKNNTKWAGLVIRACY